MRAVIFGAGNIGSRLHERLIEAKHEVNCVVRRDGVYKGRPGHLERRASFCDIDNFLSGVDIGFIAIPAIEDGKVAFDDMKYLLSRGVPVVSCEKGALGNYFPELKRDMGMIGFNATCGGGTGMLDFANCSFQLGSIERIYAIVNGTLNFVFDSLSRGVGLDEIIKESRLRGYSEPGSGGVVDLINREMKDVALKSSILVNTLGLGEVRAREFQLNVLTESDVRELVTQAERYRVMVSLSCYDSGIKPIGGFEEAIGDWKLSGGFVDTRSLSNFSGVLPSGVGNMIYLQGNHHFVSMWGDGAGVEPTVSTMMNDARRFTGKRNVA